MSFILDALRKSEQQRQHGAAPSLFTTVIPSDVEKQPAFFLYGIFALILVSAGILIGWLQPWQHNDAVATNEPAMPVPASLKAPQPALPVPESPMAIQPERMSPPQAEGATMRSRPVTELDKVHQHSHVMVESHKARAAMPNDVPAMKTHAAPPSVDTSVPPPETPVSNRAGVAMQDQEAIEMAELPLALQQEIPTLSISAHAYSGIPAKRLVRINDKLLHEGDFLNPTLRLEQITPDGMIFSYKKYLFHHGLQ